ncbi:MAG: hypothetical protein IPJ74_00765 [Saprospiraceae bacterium]|nr:hypothetical protein [Saprospiraceae bacterium]
MENFFFLEKNDFFDSLPDVVFNDLLVFESSMDYRIIISRLEFWLSLRNFLLLYHLPHRIKEHLSLVENADEVITLSQYYWLEKYDTLYQLIFGQSDDWLRKIRVHVIEPCNNFYQNYYKIKKIHFYIKENTKISSNDKENILQESLN